ncbi:MAG: universal stress protein [Acidiferrobacterales bacterium]
MAVKTILVPVEDDVLNQAVLDTALAGARRFEAHLELLYVRPDPQGMLPYATLGMSAGMKQSVIEAAERSATETADRLRTAFEQFCRDNEVVMVDKPPAPEQASAAWFEATGHLSEALTRRGRLADLIFVARLSAQTPTPQILETALLETGKPVIIVPPKSHQCIASHVTIGWNASAEAARAVSEAMPCLAKAESVTVLASRKRATSANELVDYLGWHGVKAAVQIFDSGSRSVGETLLDESRKLSADLLVIGGYTRTRARQLLFGGVTSHLLDAADIPVLMAH